MEKDSRYARWNPSLLSILRPLYPGAMPTVKANLFNIVLILDLSDVLNLNFVSGAMSNIINHIPLRFGLVPVVETDDGKKMARLFYHLIKSYGRRKTLDVFRSIVLNYQRQGIQRDKIDWADVRQAYEELVEKEREGNPEGDFPDLERIVDGSVGEAAGVSEDSTTATEAEAEAEADGSDVNANGKAKKDLSAPLDKIGKYTDRLAAKLARSPKGHVFFNGKHFNFDDDFFRYMQTEMSMQVQYLSEKIYSGILTDENKPPSMSNYFYDLPNASKRRNVYMFPAGGSKDVQIVSLPEVFRKTRFRVSEGTYLYPTAAESVYESLYVVTDLDTEDGLALVKEAISSLTSDSKTRISFIHNPTTPQTPTPENGKRPLASYLLAHLHIRGLLSQATPSQLLAALGLESGPSASPAAAASPDVVADVEEGVQAALKDKVDADVVFKQLTGGAGLRDILAEEYADYVRTSRKVARELKVLPGQSALVVNGRVVGPLPADDFKLADFKTLEDFEFRKRAEPVLQAVQEVAPALIEDKFAAANMVSMVTSVVAAAQRPDPSESGLFDVPPRPRQKGYLLLESQYTSFTIGDNSTALYRIAVLVDPLSEIGQKWSSLLQWLSNIPDAFIEVHLNPGRYADIPLKKFFRYNLLPSLSFDEEGKEVPAHAVFEDLPIEPIYTLAMDVPTAWLVRPRESLYDLDNIQLGKLFPGDTAVEAIFELDYIVIEGHAREVPHNTVARGVQLQLVTGDGMPIDDTLVVANLGYFQFKAKPGVFKLEIREGRGREIFELESVGNEGWDSPTVKEAGAEITVTSFEGLTLYPRLRRLPDMEQADVLEEESDEEDSKKGVFEDLSQKVMSIFKSPKKEPSTDLIPVKPQADINIFTVASGLLYERFVGIMILSVLRNTNSTVKFWFIENFLSPSFLEFIPHMAEKYNFQYELVTYKWPSWLRAQTEKQRIIWAYKILFLDVLFPLDLKKVIFVDADQIVRADLKELVDLDLHGAPYGYVPMGDDNKEMEGFRFWKTGYWKEFLQGKPYHISALYVIDLVRFRQDILRGQYQQLSADPNSLANLDQDLPNNLQHQVPIYSLPDDWLWCETWCSKDRLDRAKTIDLCQNPLTVRVTPLDVADSDTHFAFAFQKEPKLARARQIPEWEEYDAEIARFTRELAAQGKIHSRLAVADVNALAGGAPSAAMPETEETGSELTGAEHDSSGSKEHQRDEL
ncbi:hypothetical protein CVT26_007456 [Gymnopilus dilepis]|uniref:Glucosyltransferase 24 catalytic domain-containing protein n=1 Tax=Gymnopilus dilepis TaxID=231916 RepID=A0A409WT74_9AGAR|nr:hypothetical protein CVT26_007456 [Gymnopilus dilepis]